MDIKEDQQVQSISVFDKKTESRAKAFVDEELAQELHKAVIKSFKRRKVYRRFKGNTWAADLAEMGSLSSKNGDVKYLFVADLIGLITGLNPRMIKKVKPFFMVLFKY